MNQAPGPLPWKTRPARGEYAFYGGRRIKIGTGEEMYLLRAGEVHLLQPDPGSSVDPARDAARLLFRFPWPEEDGTAPGGDRSRLFGLTLHECPWRRRCRHHHEGHNLYFQGWAGGVLVPVLRCRACSRRHYPRDLAAAQPLIAELRDRARWHDERGDYQAGTFAHATADRIIAGYDPVLKEEASAG
jgi:hypothetical protein